MKPDEIDRILSGEEDIVPSSGFVGAVMDAVMREASEPPPIPFPWKHGVAGLVASLAMLVQLLIADPPIPESLSSGLESMVQEALAMGVGWIVLAVLVSFVSVKLSMRLAGVRD